MAGWYSSFNPYKDLTQTQVDTAIDSPQIEPGSSQVDWWDFDSKGKDAGGPQSYYKRVGRTVADALNGSGYYTDDNSRVALGANIAQLVDLARAQAAAQGNIGPANSDTVKQYLKQYLRSYLTTGNIGAATGIAGPGSTGSNYRDTFGQINANVAAGTPEQQNWYKANQASLERGIKAMTGLQTGGGLRSSSMQTIGDVFDRSGGNQDRFWQDSSGGTISPWGGSFASNLQIPQAQPQGNNGAGAGGGNGAGDQPQQDPLKSSQPQPVPGSPGMTIETGVVNTDPIVQFANQLTPFWSRLFGRPPTYNEAVQWQDRLNNRYDGNFGEMIRMLENAKYGQIYGQTGKVAPIVASGTDRAGAQAYFDWLQPGGDPETWINDFLRQFSIRR